MAWSTLRFASSRSVSSMNEAPSRHCRSARRARAPTTSRSRKTLRAGFADTGSCASSRLAFRNNSGSSRRLRRRATAASLQAAYSSPTSRVVSFSFATVAARTSQSLQLARAIGSRYFIAAWDEMRPSRIRSCTERGSSFTRPSRRDTQLGLRQSRSDSSATAMPPSCSASMSQACSMAVSASSARCECRRSRASASLASHTVARTVSSRSRRRARTRLWPSITTYRPGSAAATTTIDTCWPTSDKEPSSRRSFSGRRTRSPSCRRSSWWNSKSKPPSPRRKPAWHRPDLVLTTVREVCFLTSHQHRLFQIIWS